MLSVLIPTYNHEILQLVEVLFQQFKEQNKAFEIICYDNGSDTEISSVNSKINEFDNCTYHRFKTNGGRSKTRNLLADKAKYDWLLFLDADVLPVTDHFVKDYFQIIKKHPDIVFGGLKYREKPSNDSMLRWVYGKSREEISIEQRKNDPQKYFTSANFLIQKNIFQQFRFDETLVEYGHEDTLLALEMTQKGFQIKQIDNPVYHLGIDQNDVFLRKTEESVKNLLVLKNRHKIDASDFKILKLFDRLEKYKITGIIRKGFQKYSPEMKKNLFSEKPSLFVYDIYKLGYLCSIKNYT